MQLKRTAIKDHGLLASYQAKKGGQMEWKAGPKDIFLVCAKKGNIHLQVSFIPHPIEMGSSEAIFLANPTSGWETRVIAGQGSEFYLLQLEAGILHRLVNPSFDTKQLDQGQRFNMRDLMRLIPVSPGLMMCFDQLLFHRLNPPFDQVYEKAKFLEIFSLILDAAFGEHEAVCPVIISPVIEQKLYQVRRHIMDNIDVLPDPDRLALEFDLPRNTLKEGYKFVFGKSIHQFHADHKLEYAMQMLSGGERLVKEIAFDIGYQNPSHFIAAFKKKYGCTPKQYLKRRA